MTVYISTMHRLTMHRLTMHTSNACSPRVLYIVYCTMHCAFIFNAHRYCCARPEGQRCLVVASNGRTVLRSKSGTVIDRCVCGGGMRLGGVGVGG